MQSTQSLSTRILRLLAAVAVGAAFVAPAATTAAPRGSTVLRDAADAPIPVKIKKTANGFQLLRGGKPYVIHGVGGSGPRDLLKACGGNSVRTWGDDPGDVRMSEAEDLGLTVTVGIWLGHKENGFDYKNVREVSTQLDQARKAVLRYRNCSGLLLWGIGNEMEGYDKGDDPYVWKAVEGIARMIKKLDPNHPTMTVVAEVGGDKIKALNKYCPDIDIVGINSYAGCPSIGQRYLAAGGVKPYVVTEFGPPGTWEVGKNSWGAANELTSTQKADSYRTAWTQGINSQPMCLGSYAFTWGNKQEATSTWYGMLLPDGSKLGAVDTMTELWTGQAPAVRAPKIAAFVLMGGDKMDPGTEVTVQIAASDPQNDPLKYDWVLQYDPVSYHLGGGAEFAPPTFPEAIKSSNGNSATVDMPKYGGGYRLYCFIHDQHGEAAMANIPLFVTGNVPPPALSASKGDLPEVIYGPGQDKTYVPSGWMGNTGAIKVDPASTDNPHQGDTCMKISYDAPDQYGGVVWQSPANDWGTAPGGLNLTGAKTLSFWARGATGSEVVTFAYGIIGKDKAFYDTASGKMADVHLTSGWTKYSFDLTGKDLTRIKTGFEWIVNGSGKPVTFYLDDIRYE
ncbi:MAG: hypothetical protein ACLQVD_06975 [Capsulimonadaceae bacterium]